MGTRLPDDPLQAARELAKRHHLFIADVTEKVGERWVSAWVVYRRGEPGCRGTRLGRRRDPSELYRWICRLAGVPTH